MHNKIEEKNTRFAEAVKEFSKLNKIAAQTTSSKSNDEIIISFIKFKQRDLSYD